MCIVDFHRNVIAILSFWMENPIEAGVLHARPHRPFPDVDRHLFGAGDKMRMKWESLRGGGMDEGCVGGGLVGWW